MQAADGPLWVSYATPDESDEGGEAASETGAVAALRRYVAAYDSRAFRVADTVVDARLTFSRDGRREGWLSVDAELPGPEVRRWLFRVRDQLTIQSSVDLRRAERMIAFLARSEFADLRSELGARSEGSHV